MDEPSPPETQQSGPQPHQNEPPLWPYHPDSGYPATQQPQPLAQQPQPLAQQTYSVSCKRAACGLLWAGITLFLAFVAFSLLSKPDFGAAVLLLAVALLTGWYDVRIWNGKAKYLWFILPIPF